MLAFALFLYISLLRHNIRLNLNVTLLIILPEPDYTEDNDQ